MTPFHFPFPLSLFFPFPPFTAMSAGCNATLDGSNGTSEGCNATLQGFSMTLKGCDATLTGFNMTLKGKPLMPRPRKFHRPGRSRGARRTESPPCVKRRGEAAARQKNKDSRFRPSPSRPAGPRTSCRGRRGWRRDNAAALRYAQ